MTTERSYLQFEDRFRGASSTIKQRLQIYEPFVRPVLRHLHLHPALDLGCGRGEWLELLACYGLNAMGIDSDAAMVGACLGRGLQVEQADILAYVSSLPSNSYSILSSFHVVEHLQPDEVRLLVDEALRVLVPGGILILETPNPENLQVATNTFYLDPSHIRPIPSPYLAYLAETAGFARHAVLRLQEDPTIYAANSLSILDLFTGVSPDYALVAQKYTADPVFLEATHAFSSQLGVTFYELATRYEAQNARRLAQIEAIQHQQQLQLQALYASRSWRLTAPLRRFASLKALIKCRASSFSSPRVCASRLRHHPRLRHAFAVARHHLLQYPFLYQLGVNLYRRFRPGATQSVSNQSASISMPILSSRSAEILADLRASLRQSTEVNQ